MSHSLALLWNPIPLTLIHAYFLPLVISLFVFDTMIWFHTQKCNFSNNPCFRVPFMEAKYGPSIKKAPKLNPNGSNGTSPVTRRGLKRKEWETEQEKRSKLNTPKNIMATNKIYSSEARQPMNESIRSVAPDRNKE